MENNFVTVDSLIEKLKELSRLGYGDMKIKCQDGYLHNDEIGYDYLKREIKFRSNLFNFPPTEKVKKFCDGLKG